MRIVMAGIMGRYPWGGVTWCSLMYLLGLRRLGHEVWYLEDTCECNYDPDQNTMAENPAYALRLLDESLTPFGLGDRWCYVDHLGTHHGIQASDWERICREADLFLVLSGGCWVWRDHYLRIPVKAFIDSDPAFTQLSLQKAREAQQGDNKKQWYVSFFETYDRLFTFGGLIGTPGCDVPTAGFHWRPTLQPVCTDLWTPNAAPLPSRPVWTTVMTWRIQSFEDIGGNKDAEFLKVLPLASQLREQDGVETELAVNGPRDFLREHGWRCVDAMAVSRDLWRYHAYLSASRGELSVAKHTYVASRCGWFSDRTACYLASGRPAVVQATGLEDVLPTGEGLLVWKTAEQALEAVRRVELDHALHARRARELALEHLDGDKVLTALLEACTG